MSQQERSFEGLLDEVGNRPRNQPDNSLEQAEAVALLLVAQRLSRLRQVRAPERLRARALARLLAAPPRPGPVRLVPRRPVAQALGMLAIRLAASVLVAVFLGYGTMAVSAASLPDSPLYSVKLLVEDMRVAVAPAEQKPQIYVEQAVRRLEETEALIQTGRLPEAERAIEDASRRIASARAAAEQAPRQEQVREAIGTTSARARAVAEALSLLGGSAPAASLMEAPFAGVQPLPRGEGALPEGSAQVAAPQSSRGFLPIGSPAPEAAGVAAPSRSAIDSALRAPGAVDSASSSAPSGFVVIDSALASPETSAPAGAFGQIEPSDLRSTSLTATPDGAATATPASEPEGLAPSGVEPPQADFGLIQVEPAPVTDHGPRPLPSP